MTSCGASYVLVARAATSYDAPTWPGPARRRAQGYPRTRGRVRDDHLLGHSRPSPLQGDATGLAASVWKKSGKSCGPAVCARASPGHRRVPGQEHATVGWMQRAMTRRRPGAHHDGPTGKVKSPVREGLQRAQALHFRGLEAQHVEQPHEDIEQVSEATLLRLAWRPDVLMWLFDVLRLSGHESGAPGRAGALRGPAT